MLHAMYATKWTIPALGAREARRLFFKADRPRAIDRYIDFFGGAGGATATTGDDLCGQLLERLA